ncbi:hypothetical protein HPULCUR_006365 [Helicostylum pulchrum]|uniref:Uncharacterized protein n=1 Tax=Helicostylum pulchrum TaxID=562976 RepID=A0ABP9Y1Q2_9FUNG
MEKIASDEPTAPGASPNFAPSLCYGKIGFRFARLIGSSSGGPADLYICLLYTIVINRRYYMLEA